MRALSATAVVSTDHKLTVQVPSDIPSGLHQVIVVLETTQPPGPLPHSEWRLPVHNVGLWPEGFTVRREDIYGDDGR